MAERLRAADRMRPSSRQRGYDADWERYRADHLRRHPWCGICGQKAVEVHHIVPIGAGGARLDDANLQSLCRRHHSAKTMTELNRRRVPRHA
jgi:5-methylcytosine-specific restriction endonuclease McrA